MAAGLGSRYGGIKQLEPVGPGGEIIMDYSVHDAVEAGFDKVVFIIRKDLEKDFKEVVGDRLSRQVETAYVFQDVHDLPAGIRCPEGRTKPWGTGQAVLCCRGVVDTPFLVINADDYYGKDAFRAAHEFLAAPEKADKRYHFCMVGFQLGNTLSENGTVTRGICRIDENGKLEDIAETFGIRREGAAVRSEDGGTFALDHPVSMNMWGFTPDLFPELENRFIEFLRGPEGKELKSEYLLPTQIDQLIKEGLASVSVLHSADQWFGVTYKEDRDYVVERFAELTRQGVYHNPLFGEAGGKNY